MPDTPRLAPTTEADWDERTAELMAQLGGLNIFRTLAHHPQLLRRWLGFGGHVLMGSTLDPRTRELVILRVGWRCHCDYEFGQHTVIGKRCGLTAEEIVALTRSPYDHPWSAEDRALIALADDLAADDCVGNGTWLALATQWSEAELVELLVLAGYYRLVSGFLTSAGVQLDDGIPGFPT